MTYPICIVNFTPVMAEFFTIGTIVRTHSLTTQKYNGLVGEVIGKAVEKEGVMRLPLWNDGGYEDTTPKSI